MKTALRILLAPLVWVASKLGTTPQVSRSTEEQARVDRECRRLALYQSRNSPESVQVRREIIRLGLDIEVRDVQLDPTHRQALEAQAERAEVPALRIAEDDGEEEWLFGAEAIRAYLRRHFAI
ncbi:glutaredoxin [Billgrantia azerbaijanica]|nr:glutaredoxin [Halomonas azerbaijanica]